MSIVDLDEGWRSPSREVDVCVVGSGAAGITVAIELAASGHECLVLEGGGRVASRRSQDLYRGSVTGIPYSLEDSRLRYLGGSTNHWAGYCRRLDPVDLEPDPRLPHPGWPIRYDDLAVHYPRAETICELGDGDWDAARWLGEMNTLPLPVASDREVVPVVVEFEVAVPRSMPAGADGTYVPPSDATLTEWFEHYVTEREHGGKKLRPSTAALYRDLFRWHVADRIGGLRLDDVGVDDLDGLYRTLLTEGRRNRRGASARGEGLSPATVRSVHAMLSGALAFAVKKESLATNPAKNADPPDSETPETPCWTTEQVQQFLTDPAVLADALYPVWRVAAYTGLRRGELGGLLWDDVTHDEDGGGTIHVRRNATEVRGEVKNGPPKTPKSVRTVDIGASTVETLRAHREAQDAHRAVMGAGWHDLGLVFPTVDGRLRRPTTISLAFARLVARTDLPVATLHGLRHAHGTTLLDLGWPVHVVAARLGHDTATLLRTYAHAGDGSQDRIDGVEALLDGARPVLRVLDGPETDAATDDAQAPEARRALP